jgi:hypothetical protein
VAKTDYEAAADRWNSLGDQIVPLGGPGIRGHERGGLWRTRCGCSHSWRRIQRCARWTGRLSRAGRGGRLRGARGRRRPRESRGRSALTGRPLPWGQNDELRSQRALAGGAYEAVGAKGKPSSGRQPVLYRPPRLGAPISRRCGRHVLRRPFPGQPLPKKWPCPAALVRASLTSLTISPSTILSLDQAALGRGFFLEPSGRSRVRRLPQTLS